MLGHGCGVSQHPQFYDTNEIKFKCYHVHMWEAISVSTLMDHTWRKQSMISPLKSDKGKNQ